MKNNILILDDELLAGSYLKECIEDFKINSETFHDFEVEVVAKIADFWLKIKDNKPAIIFLDIEMPGKNGIELAQELKENIKNLEYKHDPVIIFCTAYDNYAYQAFTVHAVDYLLKPANSDKISSVFSKILNYHPNILENLNDYVYVNISGIDVKIPLKEILYFKAEMKYISVITAKKEFLLSETLINLEKIYINFLKTHRAYLINPAYIQKFFKRNNHWYVSLKSTEEILPVSRRQKQDLELTVHYRDYFEDESL